MTTLNELATETQHCGTCGAAPTQVCVVTRGRTMGAPAPLPHSRRIAPLLAAHRLGVGEGRRAHAMAVRRRLDGEGVSPAFSDRVARL